MLSCLIVRFGPGFDAFESALGPGLAAVQQLTVTVGNVQYSTCTACIFRVMFQLFGYFARYSYDWTDFCNRIGITVCSTALLLY